MSAYIPRDLMAVWLLAVVLGEALIAGLLVTRLRSTSLARLAAWLLVVAAVVAAERLCDQEPPGLRMLAIIGALLFGMKVVVSVEAQASGQGRLSPLRWLAFALGWVGMRPAVFATLGGPPLPGGTRLVWLGIKCLVAGFALMALASLVGIHLPARLGENTSPWLATAPLLLGLSLIIHFGVINILAGVWRRAGADCRSLFRTPLLAGSLGQFWGRRWNLAFSEMTAVAVYRPLAGLLGKRAATAAGFAFSGLLHELAISVPVRAGYGLPLLYFLLHGSLVLLERHLERVRQPIDRRGWLSRVWTLGWLAVPLPILFHPPFLKGVVWPLIGIDY